MKKLLMLLALSLTACASYSVSPVDCPEPPEMPELSTPLPQEPYSRSVVNDMQRWQELLMDTQPM